MANACRKVWELAHSSLQPAEFPFQYLPVEEHDGVQRLVRVEDATLPLTVPVTEAEKSLLDARLADLANNPEDQSPWSEVQARLRRLLP